MQLKILAAVFLLGFASTCSPDEVKSRPYEAEHQLVWAHDFVRALYPRLEGKKYFLSAETGFQFDQPYPRLPWLYIDVGEGPKNAVIATITGCVGNVTGPKLPLPPELSQPQAAPPTDAAQHGKKPQEDCKTGPITPKQFLSTGFQFSETGELASFTARGLGLGDPDEKSAYLGAVTEGMSDAEIAAVLKRAGGNYGPDDKAAFVKDLPIEKMERFLGRLEIESVEISPLSKFRGNLELWPFWTVRAKGTRRNGTSVTYEMRFEPFRGDLFTIGDTAFSPPGAQ